jgi:citrate synthase
MSTAARPPAGLEGAVATRSSICYVDGERGVLAYAGYDIHDLARHATFEEVCYLLWHRRLPTRQELGDLQSALAAARPVPEPILRLMYTLRAGQSMDVLRTLISALGHYDPDALDHSSEARERKAIRLTAQFGSIVATLGRVNAGGAPVQPDPVLSHSANFLYMLSGERPSGLATRAFDVALILHADHELTPSTFAARVAAATQTDLHSAIVAGIAALKGPLHGGANADVMQMLLDIGMDAPQRRVEEGIRARLERGEKIPGFGHRVYKAVEDPRAAHLRQMSRDLGQRSGEKGWFETSQHIEAFMKAEKHLDPNVEFYSAMTYHSLGIDNNLFTPIFAVSRVSGWTAHVLEQYANNRLKRQRAEYVGPQYPMRYLPLEQR